MSRTIRMIGVDLDGTLLNSEKQLTAYTREVLKKAIEQEVAVVVATGNKICAYGKRCKNIGYAEAEGSL